MLIRWFIAVLALPGMVVVFIPATLLLAFNSDTWHAHVSGPPQWRF